MDRVSAEVVARFFVAVIFIGMVVTMSMRAMHVAMRDFFVGRGAYFHHGQVETQCHAGQWMVTVENDLVVGDIGDGENHRFFVRRIAVRHAFKLHPHFERVRQAVARFYLDQRRVVFAERVVRFDLNDVRIADFLAVEFFFDFRQGVFIIAVQINHRLTAVFDQIVLGI